MRRNEKDILLGMMDDLIAHFNLSQNRSLLVRIYGVFTIATECFGSVDIIIMENCFKHREKQNSFMLFDFKGSTYQRITKFN
jgi:hypothetical protein